MGRLSTGCSRRLEVRGGCGARRSLSTAQRLPSGMALWGGQLLGLEGEGAGLRAQALEQDGWGALGELGEGGGRLEQARAEEGARAVSAEALAAGLGLLELLGGEQPRPEEQRAERVLRGARSRRTRGCPCGSGAGRCGPARVRVSSPVWSPGGDAAVEGDGERLRQRALGGRQLAEVVRRCQAASARARAPLGAGPAERAWRGGAGAAAGPPGRGRGHREAEGRRGTGAATGGRRAHPPGRGRCEAPGRRGQADGHDGVAGMARRGNGGWRSGAVGRGRPGAAREGSGTGLALRRGRAWAPGPGDGHRPPGTAGRATAPGPAMGPRRGDGGRRPEGPPCPSWRGAAPRACRGTGSDDVAPEFAGEGIAEVREAPGIGEVEPVLGHLEPALDDAVIDEQLDGRQGQRTPQEPLSLRTKYCRTSPSAMSVSLLVVKAGRQVAP